MHVWLLSPALYVSFNRYVYVVAISIIYLLKYMWERFPCTASLRCHGLLLALGNRVISIFRNLHDRKCFFLWRKNCWTWAELDTIEDIRLPFNRLHHVVTS